MKYVFFSHLGQNSQPVEWVTGAAKLLFPSSLRAAGSPAPLGKTTIPLGVLGGHLDGAGRCDVGAAVLRKKVEKYWVSFVSLSLWDNLS